MSLRTIVTTSMVVLVGLALAAATALIVLTNYLHQAAARLGTAIESVRVVEQLQVELLTFNRERNRAYLARVETSSEEAEATLHERMLEIRAYASNPEERALIAKVGARLHAFLAARVTVDSAARPFGRGMDRSDAALDEALAAMQDLIEFNLEDAQAAEREADRWDRLADIIGFSTAVLLLAGVVVTLLWLRQAALRPLLRIGESMDLFGLGDRGVRVSPEGPHELQEMARRFNDMAAALARQRDAQLTALASIAHDLRNPLAALRMSVGMVRPGKPMPPEDDIRELMRIVSSQVARLERMVSDLLDGARIEAGQLEIHDEPCDLREAARAAVDLFRSTSSDHALELDLPDSCVLVSGDAVRLEQVLNNLVSNAIKYSPAGGAIAVRVKVVDNDAIVLVEDHGLGMTREEQRRMFEPFHRVERLRATAPGVGLGLSVVQKIVHAHKGRLEVDSAPGRGTTFRVILPRLDGAAESAHLGTVLH